MKPSWKNKFLAAVLIGASLFQIGITAEAAKAPLVIEEQGSFAVGGKVVAHGGVFSRENFLSPDGQNVYGDHLYAFYQKPVESKVYPLIFQHGGAQTKRTWESTPDGREGFQNIFLRKGYSTYLIDQPRMGEAGIATEADDGTNPWAGNPIYADKTLYELSRVGTFNGEEHIPFSNAAVPHGEYSFDQFQRSWSSYEGKLDNDVNAEALAKLVDKVGPSILVTHSMGGTIGWRTPFLTDNVKAIIALEPGGTPFIFPEGEVPEAQIARFAPLSATALAVPMDDFKKLTQIPIVLYYGDNIDESSASVGANKWASELDMAEKFVAAVNRHGGQAELVKLPEIGLKGNTHFLMADLNNEEIADLMADWLHKKGLDK